MTRTKHLLLGISIGVIIVIVAVSARCCCAATSADNIRFTDLPPTIEIEPGLQASFDVTLQNFGNQYADVSINVKSLPDTITIVDGDEKKLVDMGKSVTYHITIRASNDITSGTYQFEIADKSNVDQHTWEVINVRVRGGNVPTPTADAEPEQTEAKKSPGFGIVAMASALLLAYRAGHTRS